MHRFFQALFSFKRPVIQQLTCQRLYVQQRPCILLQWHILYAWNIRILPLRRHYKMGSGSLVLTIPPGLNVITITAVNIWGRVKQQLVLRSVPLDGATEQAISRAPQLRDQPMPAVKNYKLPLRAARLHQQGLTVSSLKTKLHRPQASVHPFKFIFKDPSP